MAHSPETKVAVMSFWDACRLVWESHPWVAVFGEASRALLCDPRVLALCSLAVFSIHSALGGPPVIPLCKFRLSFYSFSQTGPLAFASLEAVLPTCIHKF